MRKITICQKGTTDVEILDDSNEAIDEYCQKLSSMFQMSNVAILKTSTSTFIARPSQLTGIVVEDLTTDEEFVVKNEKEEIPVVEEKTEENPPEKVNDDVDIITDID